MTSTITPDVWQRYRALLPDQITRADPKIPAYLEKIELLTDSSYVPSESFLAKLRTWLVANGRPYCYYFTTETLGNEEVHDYLVPSLELSQALLLRLNQGIEAVLTGQDFDWAVFVDHEGTVYVGGPRELLDRLEATASA